MLLTIMRHYSSSVLLKFPSISSSESHVLGAVIFFKKWKGLKKRTTILCLPTALLYATRGAAELSTSHFFSFVLAILSLVIPSCFYGNSITSWIVQDFNFPSTIGFHIYRDLSSLPTRKKIELVELQFVSCANQNDPSTMYRYDVAPTFGCWADPI